VDNSPRRHKWNCYCVDRFDSETRHLLSRDAVLDSKVLGSDSHRKLAICVRERSPQDVLELEVSAELVAKANMLAVDRERSL
jgi:hypothetical protein